MIDSLISQARQICSARFKLTTDSTQVLLKKVDSLVNDACCKGALEAGAGDLLASVWEFLINTEPHYLAESLLLTFVKGMARFKDIPNSLDTILDRLTLDGLPPNTIKQVNELLCRINRPKSVERSVLVEHIRKLESMFHSETIGSYEPLPSKIWGEIDFKAFCLWASGGQPVELKPLVAVPTALFAYIIVAIFGQEASNVLIREVIPRLRPIGRFDHWSLFLIEISEWLTSSGENHRECDTLAVDLLRNVLREIKEKPSDIRYLDPMKDAVLAALRTLFAKADETGSNARTSLSGFLGCGFFYAMEEADLLSICSRTDLNFRSIRRRMRQTAVDSIEQINNAWIWASYSGAAFDILFAPDIEKEETEKGLIQVVREIRAGVISIASDPKLLLNHLKLIRNNIYIDFIGQLYSVIVTHDAVQLVDMFNRLLKVIETFIGGNKPGALRMHGLKPIIEFVSSKEANDYLHFISLHEDTPEYQELLSDAVTDLFNLKENIVGSDSRKHVGAAAIVNYLYQKMDIMKPDVLTLSQPLLMKNIEKLSTWMLTFLFDDKHGSALDSMGVGAISDITHNNVSSDRESKVHEAVTYFHKWVDRCHPDQYLYPETWKRLSEILLNDGLRTGSSLDPIQILRTKRLLSNRLQRFRIKRDTFPLFPEVDKDFAASIYQWITKDGSMDWENIEKFSFDVLGPLDKVDRDTGQLSRIQFVNWLKNLQSVPNPLKEFLLDLNDIYNSYPNRTWGFPTYLRSAFTDMRWYGKYGPQSGILNKVSWHLCIDQPEKFYIDSYVLLQMVRKFAVSAVEHADACNIFIRMHYEQILDGEQTNVILELANDDHTNPGRSGWSDKSPLLVLGDRCYGNQMRTVYEFYIHHCSDFHCHEVHQDSEGRMHYCYFDARLPGTLKEQTLIAEQCLWDIEDLKSLNLARIMGSDRGSFLRFIVPVYFRHSAQSKTGH